MPAYSMIKAKTNLSRLVEEALRGEEVIITRDGTAVAKIVPLPRSHKRPPAGLLRGRATWTKDAFSPETDLDIQRLFEGEGE